MKMADQMARNAFARSNYELLRDYDNVLGLICVLPMLKVV